MSEATDSSNSFNQQKEGEKSNVTCHLVSLPTVVLTRIDEGNVQIANMLSSLKKSQVKRLGANKRKPKPSKSTASKLSSAKIMDLKPRKRPKREIIVPAKFLKSPKVSPTVKLNIKNKPNTVKKSPKLMTNAGSGTVKNMLKKTMIQKRSKIIIPPAKKIKLPSAKIIKPIMTKKPIQTKIEVPQFRPIDNDSSEDEFLYDELIQELENSPFRQKQIIEQPNVKTTNITLKPNSGNKPPIVVKGGIVKKTNLPADLKPIATKITNGHTHSESVASTEKKGVKRPNSIQSPVPSKLSSPWPVTITSPSKSDLKYNKKNVQKKNIKTKVNKVFTKATPKLPKKQSNYTPESISKSKKSADNAKPISLQMGNPKIGPKQTAKVVPLLKPVEEDDMSDEYTEIETLENIDSENIDLVTKVVEEFEKKNKSVLLSKDQLKTISEPLKKPPDVSKDDEDPNLDLLRILTDDSDEPLPIESNIDSNSATDNNNKENDDEPNKHSSSVEQLSPPLSPAEPSEEVEEEPPVRTIYDLMNEISLEHPSWNLHIIPETNAFCIAQVTKGRLGLPTLKKCIELDPDTYHAKVYIHQYHIKRFDGVYDSEETIIALIHEINSIKA